MNVRNLAAFSFLHWLIWGAIGIAFFGINGFFTDGLGLLFTCVFILGHIGLFALALGLLCAPWRLIGPRSLQVASVIISTLFSLFFSIDLLVYSQYRFHISPAMLELFFGPAGREIFAFSMATWVLAAGGILLLLTAEWGLTCLAKKIQPATKWIGLLLALWAITFLAYNGLYAWGKFQMVSSIIAQRAILPLANPFSLNSQLRKWGFEPKKDPYATPVTGTLHYPLAPLTCHLPGHPKNVLVLLVESWRADSVTPEIMPHLSAWAAKPGMTYFTNHLSGGNATEAGVFSLFYALPYSYWNDFTSRQLPPVLVSQALETGYIPAIYSSGKLNSPTFHQNIFATVPHLRLESKGDTKWQRDENAIEDFENFLRTYNKQAPFFAFIFLDATHGSNYPAEDAIFTPAQEINYLLLNKNTDPTPYLNSYKNSVHFIDRMLERIFTDLRKQGLLKDTVIILTGDHGQEINDTRHNFWGHNSNFAKYQTHVPLFVWDASRPNQTRTYRTNHYDVAPTLLRSIYGCTNPPTDYAIGTDLFDDTPRPFSLITSYTKKAIRTGDQLTVLDQYGAMEKYDENLHPSHGAEPAAIKKALSTFAQFYR